MKGQDVKSSSAGELDMDRIESALLTLNYRLTSRALGAFQRKAPSTSDYDLYEGYHDLMQHAAVEKVRAMAGSTAGNGRTFHSLLNHYVQYRALPYENELSMWMRGAAANINGEKIYLKDVHSWCQKRSTLATRRIMEKETSSLSKFLKQFALSSWEFVLELLESEFGYGNYVAYCRDKKGVDYASWVSTLEALLEETDALYFETMEKWAQSHLGASLRELNRFDAIYLVGLGQFDGLYPSRFSLRDHLGFFHRWGIEPARIPGLHLDIDFSPQKGSQGMTFTVRAPDEVHLVINPQGGWIDLETLYHEMGHALSAVFTSPDLTPVEKDFHPSNTLSESYAFLIQNMCFSPAFLEHHLGLGPDAARTMIYYKTLKEMTFFRRYAAKFLAEYRMFTARDVGNGDFYASLLRKHTGFSYRPETHLFDIAPELYALDYVMSWMAEATMERALSEEQGSDWMLRPQAGKLLKDWWKSGNAYEIEELFSVKGIGSLNSSDLVQRWKDKLTVSPEPSANP